ncbi:MAG: hypothetical protein PUC47_04335 [Oscillospiraceae bacterium]|nr:hypothetical protein [Oscillospiraceae bacterium]
MEPVFVSRFEVTLDRYRDWARHPVGRTAVKNRRRSLVLRWIIVLGGLLILTLGLLWRDVYEILLGCFFAVWGVLRLSVLQERALRKQYRMLKEARKQDRWIRTTTFSDRIVTEEGNTRTEHAYGDIRRVTEQNGCCFLWVSEDFVLRIPLCSFVQGDGAAFLPFIRQAVQQS